MRTYAFRRIRAVCLRVRSRPRRRQQRGIMTVISARLRRFSTHILSLKQNVSGECVLFARRLLLTLHLLGSWSERLELKGGAGGRGVGTERRDRVT